MTDTKFQLRHSNIHPFRYIQKRELEVFKPKIKSNCPDNFKKRSQNSTNSNIIDNITTDLVLISDYSEKNEVDTANYKDHGSDTRVRSMYELSESLEDPLIFINSLLFSFRNDNFELSLEYTEMLIDFYFPFLDDLKNSDFLAFGKKQHFALLELIACLIIQYSPSAQYFQAFSLAILTDFLILMRHSEGDFLIQGFRCFSEIYIKTAPYINTENFNSIVTDFCLTFTPNHPLFSQACFLVENNAIHGFDSSTLLLKHIKMKTNICLKVFESIDTLLRSKKCHAFPIIQFLFQTAVSDVIWSKTATELIKKHIKYVINNRKVMKWTKNFIKRSFQWMQLCKMNGRYRNRRLIVANAMSELAKDMPECIRVEIITPASTLIMSGLMPELKTYFNVTGAFDQSFLDEIDVLEVREDLMDQLKVPKEKLSINQIKRIEAKKKLLDFQMSDDESLLKLSNSINASIAMSKGFINILITLILIIVVLVIYS